MKHEKERAQAERERTEEEDNMSEDSEGEEKDEAPLSEDVLMRLGLDEVNEEIEYLCQVI